MLEQWQENLRVIGSQLTDGIFPSVSVRGTVLPGKPPDLINKLGHGEYYGKRKNEHNNENQRHQEHGRPVVPHRSSAQVFVSSTKPTSNK